jgi:hypothetical protein
MKQLFRRRYVIVLGAVVVVAVVLGVWRATSPTASKTMALNGDHLQVPGGWSSESFVNASGMIVLRVGSFAFRHASNDDVGQVAQAAMRPNDVLINIIDVTATDPGNQNAAYLPVTGALTIDAAQAVGQEGYSSPAAAIRGARINGRNFYVSVSFGRAPPTTAQVAAANGVLRTLGA